LDDLTEDDVIYEARQKAVDMRIDPGIASLAYKRQVDAKSVPALASRICSFVWVNMKDIPCNIKYVQ